VSVVELSSSSSALKTTLHAPPRLAGARRFRDPADSLPDGPDRTSRYQSPLRYPGAKSFLVPVIERLLRAAAPVIGTPAVFVEPFAGGASTSIRLASNGAVDRVILADADPLVARFWQVAASDCEWLIDRMWSEPVTLERWDYWRSWMPRTSSSRDTAVKCLFLNRTTFSGILHGRAGPIGGRTQAGMYGIDCRFNKEELERRLRYVASLYSAGRIADVWCQPWDQTVSALARRFKDSPHEVVAYLDPPYFNNGRRLYARSFDPAGGYASTHVSPPALSELAEHRRLARYLLTRMPFRWILSYDDHPSLTKDLELYARRRVSPTKVPKSEPGARSWRVSRLSVKTRYSVASASNSRELILTTLPPSALGRKDSLLASQGGRSGGRGHR
jgi:DNA adenine methylase